MLNIPDNYKVLFLQGGASQQFRAVPMNLMKNGVADYIVTGQWAKKRQEAEKYGKVNVIASSADKTFSYIPDCSDLPIDDDADYVYICENNTIYGTKYKRTSEYERQNAGCRCIFLFPVRASRCEKYGVLYGGVQKNIGPAGVVIAIIREDLIRDDVLPGTPTMLKYKTQADKGSLYNTPPCYGIYICGKIFKWLKKTGAARWPTWESTRILDLHTYDGMNELEGAAGSRSQGNQVLPKAKRADNTAVEVAGVGGRTQASGCS